MIRLDIVRKPARGKLFVEYLMTVSIDGKKYDLAITFLVWSEIKPHEETKFFLRPEAEPAVYSGPRSPVKKRKNRSGFFKKQHQYYWKPGIEEVKDCVNTLSFPLNPRDNHELFSFCFSDPVTFSTVYYERLKELEVYSNRNDQEIWSAPKWSEVTRSSLVPVEKVPKEADDFFKHVFTLRLQDAGYEIQH